MAEQQDNIALERERRKEKIKAHTASAEETGEGRKRQAAADQESLRVQRPLEYGVLLTAVGGLAVRFADEGFQFVEDYALRLGDVQAIFSPTDSNHDHIRVLFEPIAGARSAAAITEVHLDLLASEGSLFWKVSGLSTDKRLSTSLEVASDILLKLTDISEHSVKLVSNG